MSDLLSRPILVLSPHPDDAVLSVGGLLLQHSDAQVATVFTADPPLERVKKLSGLATPETRRGEDSVAMAKLGVKAHLLDLVDAIDRVGEDGARLYQTLPSLCGPVLPTDAPTCDHILEAVKAILGDRVLLCPMAIGAHVDHQLAAHVGRRLSKAGRAVLFYEDAPYVYPDPGPRVTGDSVTRAADRMRGQSRGLEDVAIDPIAKAELVSCYASQVVELFGNIEGYRESSRSHYDALGAIVERLHHLRF
ncbi:MAG: hypothetical protein GY811_00875 [Myxococcales bacterium]|nr:hypothetical protein [Myxococcales bacterium]